MGIGNDTISAKVVTFDGSVTLSPDGGLGTDRLVIDASLATVSLRFALTDAAKAMLTSPTSISLVVGSNFEAFTVTGGTAADNFMGGNGDDVLMGGGGADTLTGGDGNDTLDSGSDTVGDTLAGGLGNDTYFVNTISDVITESASAGTDLVKSTVSFTLGANVEILTLIGTANIVGNGNILANVLTGNSGNNLLDGRAGADTMAGGLGDDTYVVDNVGDVVTESASAGADLVQSAATFALGSHIENLTLTGTGHINGTGNASSNVLTGNGGNNLLDGKAGADVMAGGLGHDTYIVDNIGDVARETASAGTDLVQSTVAFTLGANIENLTLTGTSNIAGTGNALVNVLTGNQGNNILDGGTGADAMAGGLGSDTYVVDNISDIVSEGANAGTDLVQSSVTFALGANVENLILTGLGHNNGIGNALANVLTGSGGNNLLDGGVGADKMSGGLGNDTYVVDNIGDAVTEAAGAGMDTVQTAITFTLGSNVENLTLTGAGHINGTGNSLANFLSGNSGNNLLDGGSGADTMSGGLGGDIYVVDNVGDVATEVASAGTDLVQSTVAFVLGANIENLTLMGTSNVSGTGNSLANTLIGNDGNNVLDGGIGADAMAGGLRNDTYVIDDVGDTVTEASTAGTDLVQSAVAFTLGINLENLTLTGTSHISGTGNTVANVLIGNDGNNLLDGKAGADAMAGGLGNDTYVVDDSADTVTEAVNAGSDLVQSAVTFTLGANIEQLALIGGGHVDGTGNALANALTGNGGNNFLDGKAGADSMAGGLGNDTYVVDDIGDTVTEAAGAGIDLVQSATAFTLGTSIENLTLTGTGHINGTGNTLSNVLTGNSGNNVLDGGTGADTLAGLSGNDIYVVDNAGDTVTEATRAGTDLVRTTITFALGANVENLTLVGTATINGTGNELANVLAGNSANNILSGGAGADSMAGGQGNDTYIVDNEGDLVIEAASAGTDLVQSAVTFTLGTSIENLTLTGTSHINAAGNSLANVMTGNGGNNVLNGGAGADTMMGGLGDDTYVVETLGDIITESASAGIDLVESAISFSLAGTHLENLTLTGTAAISATGSAGANVITGNNFTNVITGGAGADVLIPALDNYADAAVDRLVFNAGDSTGMTRDQVYGLDLSNEDLIDLAILPNRVASEVVGTLTTTNFNLDIANAVNASLDPGNAILFTPTSGDLFVPGHQFLVVDGNNDGSYTAGADYLVELIDATGTLDLTDFL